MMVTWPLNHWILFDAGHWQSCAVQQDVLQWHLHWGAWTSGDITSWGLHWPQGQKGNGLKWPNFDMLKVRQNMASHAKHINWDTVLNFINTYAFIYMSLVQVLPPSLSRSYFPVSISLGEICFGEVREERQQLRLNDNFTESPPKSNISVRNTNGCPQIYLEENRKRHGQDLCKLLTILWWLFFQVEGRSSFLCNL